MAFSTNLPEVKLEDTVEYFNNYFNKEFSVSQNVMDALTGFFQERTDNDETTKALVHAVLVTSLSNRINPMSVLDEFKKLDGLNVDSYLAMFLNMSRKNTSLIGVSNLPSVSYHVARTILP